MSATAEPAAVDDMVADNNLMSLGKRQQPILSMSSNDQERDPAAYPKRIKLRFEPPKNHESRGPFPSAVGNLQTTVNEPQAAPHPPSSTTVRNNSITIIIKSKNSSTVLTPAPTPSATTISAPTPSQPPAVAPPSPREAVKAPAPAPAPKVVMPAAKAAAALPTPSIAKVEATKAPQTSTSAQLQPPVKSQKEERQDMSTHAAVPAPSPAPPTSSSATPPPPSESSPSRSSHPPPPPPTEAAVVRPAPSSSMIAQGDIKEEKKEKREDNTPKLPEEVVSTVKVPKTQAEATTKAELPEGMTVTPMVEEPEKKAAEAEAVSKLQSMVVERVRLGHRGPRDPTPLLAYDSSPRILPRAIPTIQDSSNSFVRSFAPEEVPISHETPTLSRDKLSREENEIVSHLERYITAAGTGTESARGLAQLLRFSVLAEKVLMESALSTAIPQPIQEPSCKEEEEEEEDDDHHLDITMSTADETIRPAIMVRRPSHDVAITSLMHEWCSRNSGMLNDLGCFEDVAIMCPENTYLDRPPVSIFTELSKEDNAFLSEYDQIRLLRTFLGFVTSRLEIIREMCSNCSAEEALVTRTYSFWVQRLREYV